MINLDKISPMAGTSTAGSYMPVFNTIYIHCSATPPGGWVNSADRIHTLHVDQNGWDAIGYHYVITLAGVIEGGRPRFRTGAGVSGHNSDSLHICLIGGLDEDHKPSGDYTVEQWDALEDLVKALLDESVSDHELTPYIKGHRDTDPMKACPCFSVANWWSGVLKKTSDPKPVVLSEVQSYGAEYDKGFKEAVELMKKSLEKLRSKA